MLQPKNMPPEPPLWYLKRRRLDRPSGSKGRPPTTLPLAERRRLSKLKYRARLATRGFCIVKLVLAGSEAAHLRLLAKERKLSPGDFVASLLPALPEKAPVAC